MDKAQWKHMNRRLDAIEGKLDSLLSGEEPKRDIYHRAVGIDPVQGEGSDRTAWGIQGAYVTTSQPNQFWEHVDESVAPDPGSWITAKQMAEIDNRLLAHSQPDSLNEDEWDKYETAEPCQCDICTKHELDERFASYEQGRIQQMSEWSERNLTEPPYGPPPGRPDEDESYGDAS